MRCNPADLSVQEASEAIRQGSLSAEVLTRAHLDRIRERDEAIKAFVHVAEDEALAAACEADRANREGRLVGPLHGIPFAIKDIFDVKGWPVRWGSRWQAERIADRTAPAVQAMLDAGAIPLGLVTTYELATVGPDQTSLYVQPRNPWNHAHVTGGSSSGSAAAVAAGMVRIALGTDTGGSVRSPSSYCGVVGFKPTFGAISLEGVMHLSPSLDHAGPIARTVSEAAMAFCVLTGQKQLDLRCDPKKIRIGFARSWIPTDSDGSDLLTLMDNAAASLSLAGMQIDLIELPDYATIEGHATQLILAEGHQSFGQEVVASPELFGKRAAKSIAAGGSISDETVAEAQKAGATFTKTIDDLLQDHDVLILPTVATPAPRFAHFDASETIWTEMRTIPFNLSGHPAISVPVGEIDTLPMGLQIVGRKKDDATVLRVASVFEASTDHCITAPLQHKQWLPI